jgi:hypothetical protein
MAIDNANFVDFGEGMGSASAQDVNELNKALEAGAGYSGAPTALTGGGALQVESLDSSLRSVTYEMKNIKLWPILTKDQAFNTIEEYNRQDSFGDQARGFIGEGSLPRSEDASYTRQIQRVRFIGVTRELTHVYTLVRNAHGDAIAREIRSGTMRILEIAERGLFDGRGYYSNAGKFDGGAAVLDADLAWEGLDAQLRRGESDPTAQAKAFTGYGLDESTIADQRGAILDEDALEDGGRIVADNFGYPNLMVMDTKTHSDLGRQFYPKERVNPMGVQNGKAGFVLQSFVSSAGEFQLMSDVFLRPKRKAFDPVHSDAPAQPSGVAASDVDSKFASSDAGDYIYYATAIKEASATTSGAGEGPASPASVAVTVASGDKVTLTIPAVTGAFAYAVYRSIKDGAATTAEFIGYGAPTTVGGACTFVDMNHKLPGSAQAYLLSNDSEIIKFKQLAPLMKMDLAIVATAYRWMQLLYGTPIVYAPRKNLLFENIGRAV